MRVPVAFVVAFWWKLYGLRFMPHNEADCGICAGHRAMLAGFVRVISEAP